MWKVCFEVCNLQLQGLVSAGTIKSFVMNDNPDLPKMVLKKGVMKVVERGLIKQVKGKGFSGSFKVYCTQYLTLLCMYVINVLA